MPEETQNGEVPETDGQSNEPDPGKMSSTAKVVMWSSIGAFVFAGALIGIAIARQRGAS